MRFFRRKPQGKDSPSPPKRWAWVKWRWPFSRKNIPHDEETPSRPSRSRFRLPFKRDPTPPTKTTVSQPSTKEKSNDEDDEESTDKPSKKTRFAIFVAAVVLLKKLFSGKKKEETPPAASIERSRLSKLAWIVGQLLLLGLLGLGVQYVDIERGFQQYITPLLRPSQEMLLQENQRLATANRELLLNHAQMTSTAIYATAVMVNVETAVSRANQQATAKVAAMVSQETAQARQTEQANSADRTATAVLLNNTVTAAAVQRAATRHYGARSHGLGCQGSHRHQ